MEWVETTGSTVAAAIERALERLGVSQADAEIVVLEEPKSSMFGLRKTEARIRARVRPVQARAKRPARRNQERDRGRRRGGDKGDGRREEQETRTRGDSGSRPPRSEQQKATRQQTDRGQEKSPVATNGEKADQSGPGGPRRARKPRSNRARQPGDSQRQPRETTTEEEQMSIETQAELAEQFVQGVVDRFGLTADLSRTIDDETVRIDVVGDSLGLLIGPRGATIDAIQELARTAVQRRGEDERVRIVVDVGGYRVRRAAALQQFALRVASEVAESGEPQALDPMSAADRKVVHDAVNEIGTVHTTSEGQDPRRYVVIHPGAARREGTASDE